MSVKTNITFRPGSPLPLGANLSNRGVLFSIFSRNATSVSLVLFDSAEPESEYTVTRLDPVKNKTGDIWHIQADGIKEGQVYGYKIDGPFDPLNGHRFNVNKLLLDPYSKAITGNFQWDLTKAWGYDADSKNVDLSMSKIDSTKHVPRSIVVDTSIPIDDKPLNIPPEETIIYELHVKGFTFHESSNVKHRGTYKGLTEKIPYLKELGVTAVELLPVQEFDMEDNININPLTGEKLKNFWGYSTIAFFAPKGTYSSGGSTGQQVLEFREMVKSFHDAGIEVILDIVFNHTGEGDQKGPTVSFRGIDNSIYYILKDNKRLYKNFSGCGNTFNCNHPLVRDFILDCLRYWVTEIKVDGFRFDLASILGRDEYGNITGNPPLIDRIEEDPILRNTKIIAEAWDAAGAYQVGEFPGRWAEWNGKYRDDVRRFWKGDKGCMENFTTRITGSSDLFLDDHRSPQNSINFITCHDGFTLNDLVSFNNKSNIENGENNRDGENYNYSFNFGIEGNDSTDLIDRTRQKQMKNFIATLFLSQGIPMLCAGDEFRKTRDGNNNSYCHDNEKSWINWDINSKNEDLFRFIKTIIRFRKKHRLLWKKSFLTGKTKEGHSGPDISWHGFNIGEPDWGFNSHTIGMLLNGEYCKNDSGKRCSDMYVIFNASVVNRNYNIPQSPSGKKWKITLDTSKPAPHDIYEPGKEPYLDKNIYYVKKLSTVVLTT
ncbi:glycogen debranching protein GlgX [Spirochaetota bacterium]